MPPPSRQGLIGTAPSRQGAARPLPSVMSVSATTPTCSPMPTSPARGRHGALRSFSRGVKSSTDADGHQEARGEADERPSRVFLVGRHKFEKISVEITEVDGMAPD